MHSPLTAVVLCVFAQAAMAQCVATPDALDARAEGELAKPAVVAVAPNTVIKSPVSPKGGELIKTAAAGTRDAPAMVRETVVRAPAGEENEKRGGTAMLLAALALMSGIALRRYGAPRQ